MNKSDKNILIIDDNIQNLHFLKEALSIEGYITRPVTSGYAALQTIETRLPDLILLDINMPAMDGFEVCKIIKENVKTKNIPIIFLSASSNIEDKVKAFDLGGVDYIVKPFHTKEIFARVKTQLEFIEMKNKLLNIASEQEILIKKRTQELESANEDLKNEIEERRKTEEMLRESEEFLYQTIDNIPSMIFIKDAKELRFIHLNKAGEELLGLSKNELYGKNDYDFFPKEQADFFANKDREVIENSKLIDIKEEPIQTRKNGKRVLHTRKLSISDENGKPQYLIGISEDITERKFMEEQIRESLIEKETLLRELYHRTKNNMQVISSYLQLQSLYSEDDKLDRIVRDVVSRIQSMSLVHQKLYRSKNLSKISIKEYIEELVILIMSYYNISRNNVSSEFEIENIEMLIDIAVPLGLVVSELISNSFKYAFPHDKKGIIKISLQRKNKDSILLTISDNGVGLPPEFDLKKSKSVGFSTTVAIVEEQLQGTIHYENLNGLTIQIMFNDNIYKERI